MRRGDQAEALIDGERAVVLLLDWSPDGWWVYVEDRVDRAGHPLVVSCKERDLDALCEPDLFS